jgi:hypothetical protein
MARRSRRCKLTMRPPGFCRPRPTPPTEPTTQPRRPTPQVDETTPSAPANTRACEELQRSYSPESITKFPPGANNLQNALKLLRQQMEGSEYAELLGKAARDLDVAAGESWSPVSELKPDELRRLARLYYIVQPSS